MLEQRRQKNIKIDQSSIQIPQRGETYGGEAYYRVEFQATAVVDGVTKKFSGYSLMTYRLEHALTGDVVNCSVTKQGYSLLTPAETDSERTRTEAQNRSQESANQTREVCLTKVEAVPVLAIQEVGGPGSFELFAVSYQNQLSPPLLSPLVVIGQRPRERQSPQPSSPPDQPTEATTTGGWGKGTSNGGSRLRFFL